MVDIFDEITFEESPQGDIFDQLELETKPSSSFIEKTSPYVEKASQVSEIPSQLSARGLESIVALPREMGEFLERLVPRETIVKGAQKIGLGEGAAKLLDLTQKYAPYKLFPTQEQTRSFTKQLFGDLFEPKNEIEKKLGEGFGEFASMVFPFMGGVKPLRALMLSTGANLAKFGGESVGLSEKSSNLLKLATYGLGSFIHPKAGKKFYNKQYEIAETLLPENATVASHNLEKGIDLLEKNLKKGGLIKSDLPALQQIRTIRSKMQGAQTPVEELIAIKRKLNGVRTELYDKFPTNKPGLKAAKRNLDQVSKVLDKSLNEYAKFQNPQWGKYFREADNAFGAVQQSEKAARFLKRYATPSTITHAGLLALVGHLGGLKAAAGGAVVSYPAYKAVQTLNQIMRSAPLKREFLRLYKDAIAGNSKGTLQSLKKMDKMLEE